MYTRKSICAIYLLLARRWVAWERGRVSQKWLELRGLGWRRGDMFCRSDRLYHT